MLSSGRHCFIKTISSLCALLFLAIFYPVAALFAGELTDTPSSVSEPAGTGNGRAIFPWYGEFQYFGSPGLAQRRVNLLGRVDPGAAVTSMTYRLNNGPQQHLNLGPDTRRLSRTGDFNVDIDAGRLREGENSVSFTARKENGTTEKRDITVRYSKEKWPLPFSVAWEPEKNIQQAVQIVDGLWQLTDRGLRTAPGHIGYDRSFALGDADWTSYEVLFPLTIHRVDTGAFASPESVGPGFGIILHWLGHTDTPVSCGQPCCGWLPTGARIWHFFNRDGRNGLNILTKPLPTRTVALPYQITTGITYYLRARVESRPFRNLYFMKFWKEGEQEPDDWSLRRSADSRNLDHGGLLIVAHHVDMTVGNIEILPVPSQKAPAADGSALSLTGLKKYLVFLPLLLTLAAGGVLILVSARQGRIFSQKISAAVCLAISGLLLIVLAEPFFPDILYRYALNAKWTAGLYLGLGLGRLFLQAFIWLLVVLFILRAERRNI